MKSLVLAMTLLMVLPAVTMASGNNEDGTTRRVAETEKVVVTATMTEKHIDAAPGAVEVLTAREIKALGAVTVAEALEWSTGLVVAGETGRASVPSIRGTGNKHTLVLVDGRRLALGYKDFVDVNQIPVTMIDRIEIVRGPNSAIYGSDAIGGVVNIITRKTPGKTEARVTGRFGGQIDGGGDHFTASACAGTRQGPLGVLLAGGFRDKDGWNEDGALPDDGDQERLGSAAGRLSFDLGDARGLLAGFEYSDMDRDGKRFYQQKDRERQADDKRVGYFLQYDAALRAADHLMLRAYRSEHENQIEFAPAAGVTAEEDAERYLNQIEARYTAPAFRRHILTMGAEFRDEGREDSAGRDDDLQNTSVFLQDEVQLTDPLYIVLGLRFDDHSEFGDQYTPRASLVYHLHPHLRLKASYGKGFRAPSISELFVTSYRQKGKWIYQPNPDLDPEESDSYEIGVSGEFGPFRGSVTAFRNEIENLIEPVLDRTTGSGKTAKRYYTYRNIAEATTEGLEFETGLRLPLNLNLSGHLTCLETENEETGEDLEGQPDYKGSLKLGYYVPRHRFRTVLRMDHMGEKQYAGENQGAYTLWNCFLSKDLGENFNIFAGVDNIFDKQEDRDGVSITEPTVYYAGFSLRY